MSYWNFIKPFKTLRPIKTLDAASTAVQEATADTEGYVHRNLVAADIAANVLMGGHEDETISSRLSREALEGKTVGILGSEALDAFQADHGAKAEAADVERAKEVIALESASGALTNP